MASTSPLSSMAMKCLMILSLLLSQSLLTSSQLTFSKSWVAGGGKRSASSSTDSSSSSSPSSSSSMTAPVSFSNQQPYSYSPLVLPEILDQVVAALQPASLNDNYLYSNNVNAASSEEALYELLQKHKSLQDLMIKTWTVILKVRIF